MVVAVVVVVVVEVVVVVVVVVVVLAIVLVFVGAFVVLHNTAVDTSKRPHTHTNAKIGIAATSDRAHDRQSDS